jgi:two-component system response regulator BaeR
MNRDILIVEDEQKLAALLSDYLQQAGFSPFCLHNGLEVIPWIQTHSPALLVLDLMLPGRDGMDICREVRSFSDLPIIIVTARIDEIDRLLGLELGADDYICKPYSPREVVARIKAVIRRYNSEDSLTQAGLRLDVERYRASLYGNELELTAVEFNLLAVLSRTPGKLFTRQQLMDRLYQNQRVVCDRTIDSHIKKLRKKLAQVAPDEELIHSFYGVGYKFEPTGCSSKR